MQYVFEFIGTLKRLKSFRWIDTRNQVARLGRIFYRYILSIQRFVSIHRAINVPHNYIKFCAKRSYLSFHMTFKVISHFRELRCSCVISHLYEYWIFCESTFVVKMLVVLAIHLCKHEPLKSHTKYFRLSG